jgi:hypothetical protein
MDLITDGQFPIGQQGTGYSAAAGQNWSAEAAGLGGRRVVERGWSDWLRLSRRSRAWSSVTDVPLSLPYLIVSRQ